MNREASAVIISMTQCRTDQRSQRILKTMSSEVRELLENVKAGKISVDDAVLALKKKPFEDIGYAKIDLHRDLRQGAAEVIYGAGKTPEQICGILDSMKANGVKTILITRLSKESAKETMQASQGQSDHNP